MASENLAAPIWIAGYIGICFASAIGFGLLRSVWYRVPGILYTIHAAIVLWSGTMYLNFLYETPVSHIAWYLDWTVTTPLIVLALALTAHVYQSHIAWDTTLLLIFAQALTIVTGLFAHITPSLQGAYIWFIIGCCMMLLVWYIIWFPMMRVARESGHMLHAKYVRLGLFVIVLWATYPVIWMLSPMGWGCISYEMTRILFVVLPIICKPVFGFLDLYYVHQIRTTSGK